MNPPKTSHHTHCHTFLYVVHYSFVSMKVLNSTEDAHIKDMSTFEIDEHLQATVPPD